MTSTLQKNLPIATCNSCPGGWPAKPTSEQSGGSFIAMIEWITSHAQGLLGGVVGAIGAVGTLWLKHRTQSHAAHIETAKHEHQVSQTQFDQMMRLINAGQTQNEILTSRVEALIERNGELEKHVSELQRKADLLEREVHDEKLNAQRFEYKLNAANKELSRLKSAFGQRDSDHQDG